MCTSLITLLLIIFPLASIKYKQDAKVQELKSTKMHINKLRSQITAIIDQHSLVQQSINRLHTAVLAEDTRAGILRREYDSLCKSYEQMLKNHEAESKEMT